MTPSEAFVQWLLGAATMVGDGRPTKGQWEDIHHRLNTAAVAEQQRKRSSCSDVLTAAGVAPYIDHDLV